LQAKHLLQRAAERNELQELGNSLDQTLVAKEKELRQLDDALRLFRGQLDGCRQMIAAGHADMLIEGYDRRAEDEQATFLRGLRQEFEEENQLQTEKLRAELLLASVEVAEMDQTLARAREEHRQRIHEAAKGLEQKAELTSTLRQLLRQLQAIEKDTSEASRVNVALAQTMLFKQRSVGAKSPVLYKALVDSDASKDRLSNLTRQLQERIAVLSRRLGTDELYFAFRCKCDRYGLATSSLMISDLGDGKASTVALLARPSAISRPATHALVRAMSERVSDAVSSRENRRGDSRRAADVAAIMGNGGLLCVSNVSLHMRPQSSCGPPPARSASARLQHGQK
jgi:hypothetical protein